jgi:WD40 repeat protein
LSAIFLSHSSADNQVAGELRAWLGKLGYASIFLDFDPEQGIPPGRDWEKELYGQLRTCRAVIVLCSGTSMASPWCFAEITHARALGKALFPVKVADCNVHAVLRTVQVVDFTLRREEGLERLRRGLAEAGLDPANSFDWQRTRSPYPGLAAFDADDAAVFFGRDEEIGRGLDVLNRQRRFGGARFVLVLGASGSGKSSLLRAGLLPRLRRTPAQWLVVPPFRPFGCPFEGLSFALGQAFEQAGEPRPWKELHAAIADSGDALARLAGELAFALRQPEATILLCIDQLEELLTLSSADEAQRFLKVVRRAAETPASRLLIVATVRSDFLGLVQNQPALHEMSFAELLVGPMPMARVGEIIEGPAAIAGLDLEPGLVQAMLRDTGDAGALPLLAFVLRELWEHRTGERLTLAQYADQLGGITGSVAKAAEGVLAGQTLSPQDETQLRQAFLSLVRINDEGRFTRRPAWWSDLPERIHPLLEKFVQARLLVSRQEVTARMLEVAHEALFGTWERLAAWLAADRAFLFWRKRLDQAVETWTSNDRKGEWLLTGAMLRESEGQLKEHGEPLDSDEKALIKASIAADRHQRRIRFAMVGVVGLIVAGFAVFAAWQWREAVTQQREAVAQRDLQVARRLAGESKFVFEGGDPRRSLLLAAASLKSAWTLDGVEAWSQAINSTFPRQALPLSQGKGPWSDVVFSADGKRLAAAGRDAIVVMDAVSLTEGTSPAIVASLPQPGASKLAFSPDSRLLVGAAGDHATVWSVDAASMVKELPPGRQRIEALAFDRDGKRLATAGMNYYARLFETARWTETGWVGNVPIHSVAFTPDGQWLLTSGGTGLSAWNLAEAVRPPGDDRGGPKASVVIETRGNNSKLITFVGDDRLVANGTIWPFAPPDPRRLPGASTLGPTPIGAVNRDASFVAVVGKEISIWHLWEGKEYRELGHILSDARTEGEPAVAFAPAGAWLVSAGDQLERWDLAAGPEWARLLQGSAVLDLAVSRDGKHLATTTADGFLHLWDTGTWRPAGNKIKVGRGDRDEAESHVAFSNDKKWLAVTIGKVVAVLSTADWREVARSEPENDVDGIGFSLDGRWLAALDDSRQALTLMDLASRQTSRFVHGSMIDSVSISRDGGQVLTRRDAWCQRAQPMPGEVRIWNSSGGSAKEPIALNVGKRSCQGSLRPVETEGKAAAADAISGDWISIPLEVRRPNELKSPDGLWSAKIESDPDLRSLRLRALGAPDRPGIGYRAGEARRMAFSPDSRWLATGDADGVTRIWAVATDMMILQACSRVRRLLSTEEWRTHLGEQPSSPVCEDLAK